MKKCIHACMFVIISLLLRGTLVAQDIPSVTVCGQSITDIGWSAFSKGAGKRHIDKGDAKGLYEELRKKLIDESDDWPERFQLSLFNAMDSLITGTLKLSDFKIVKDPGSLQAKQYAFIHTSFQMEFPPAADNVSCRADNEKSAIVEAAKFVMLVEHSGLEIYKPYFRKNAEIIKTLETTYDKYLYEGFPMYPWEALIAGWLLTDQSIANGPPKNQIVFMHPAAGFIGAAGAGSDTDISAVLSVEPFGWIRYTDDYSTWYGASLLTVFASDRNAGLGFALNYKNFKLGLTWHDYDDKYENPTIFVGMDLYQLLSEKNRQYTSYKEKIANILRKND